MKLPETFLNKMQEILGDEYEAFLRSYNEKRYYGLRINTLKVSVEEFLKRVPFALEPVPWTSDGFYYPEDAAPGRHPYYHAGLYYIQEPSAMLPGAVLSARPGEKVLDLCAAPGGKSVQIAAGMQNQGFLLCNDVSADRLKALVKNLELCGVRHAMVSNETPDRLAKVFPGFFDRILVDAPCSGEGMFRKDETAARSWEKFKCEKCVDMQQGILPHAHTMLKREGFLVYSTCTFNPEENEKMLQFFLNEYPEYELIDIPKQYGIVSGRPDLADGNEELRKAARLWPHKVKGEGHFTACLRKKEHAVGIYDFSGGGYPGKKITAVEKKALDTFAETYLSSGFEAILDIDGLFAIGKHIYHIQCKLPALHGVRLAKFGWYLGSMERGLFVPSHSFLMGLKREHIKRTICFPANSSEIIRYLKGETLSVEGENGYHAVFAEEYPLGWAKQSGGIMKNLYPKGWRKING